MARFARRLGISLASISAIILSGCSMTNGVSANGTITSPIGAIRGVAHGGQQPISSMHIYLYAAGTSAYGTASTSLLTNVSGQTTEDGNDNYYVTTGSDGSFSITGDYTCTSGQDIYLYGLGGYTGGSTPNTSAGLMAILGTCPASGTLATQVPYVWMNEVTTVAAAYSMSGFATDATDVSDDETGGGTTASIAQIGMANAFANASNLVDITSGTALAVTPTVGSVGTVPQADINNLANVLASCVNSSVSTSAACTTLFATATSDGTPTGVQPTDTATAAINIAHNQAANVATLNGLASATPAFGPVPATAPTDFALTLQFPDASAGGYGLAADGLGNVFVGYSGGGLVYRATPAGIVTQATVAAARRPAVDSSNNVYVPSNNKTSTNILKFANDLSSSTTLVATGATGLTAVAITPGGDIWGYGTAGSATELDGSGNFLATITGLPSPAGGENSMAINPSGDLAFASGTATGTGANSLTIYDSTGTDLIATATGGGLSSPSGVVSDASGNFWVSNAGAAIVSEISSTGAAVSSTGYTTGSVANSGAFDGAGNFWTGTTTGTGVYELNSAGNPVATFTPPTSKNQFFAADPSGNLWFTGNLFIYESVGLATPTVQPLVVALSDNKLTTRP